jgi:hypothetical protein
VRRVVTAADIDAAARDGGHLRLTPDVLVTPLARDRATALGVALDGEPAAAGVPAAAPDPPGHARTGGVDVEGLVLESRVRVVARRVLLRAGRGLADYEQVVSAVMRRLQQEGGRPCECGVSRCGRRGAS